MKLSPLFSGTKINQIWRESSNYELINHPQYGMISPNALRAKFAQTPCPHCSVIMVHGSAYKTDSKEEAEIRGFYYHTNDNKKKYCKGEKTYFSNKYVTLDHKLNKARFPDKMFDADNLEAICWKCNDIKSDNNLFSILRKRSNSRKARKQLLKDSYMA